MNANVIRVYKIRRRSDGKFSNGGSNQNFTKNGKTWEHMGHLNNHLAANLKSQKYMDNYADCDVVALEITLDSQAVPVNRLVEIIQRRHRLERQYGSVFSEHVQVLDRADLIEQFRWCLVFKTYDAQGMAAFVTGLKALGITRRDYRFSRNVFSFTRRDHAMMAKLSTTLLCNSVDLVEAAEIDIG